MQVECRFCKQEFETHKSNVFYCSDECNKQNAIERRKEYKHQNFLKNQEQLKLGIENIDYVVDRWNGLLTPRIYGKWFKSHHPDRTLDEYKKEFPGAPLYCQKDKENTSKSSGLHMKQDKYRQIASEYAKGENNPNHKSKTTEQQRKERSPYSQEFYKVRNLDKNAYEEVIKKSNKPGKSSASLEYWLNKGYSLDEAKEKRKERQSTFTLEKCIKKYGEEEGTRIFNERQIK